MLLIRGRKSVDLGPLDDDVADLAVDLDLTTAEAGERSLDAVVDGAASFVADRAALAEYDLAVPPVGSRDARDWLSAHQLAVFDGVNERGPVEPGPRTTSTASDCVGGVAASLPRLIAVSVVTATVLLQGSAVPAEK